MIKINRTPKPIELTEEVQKNLTNQFKEDNSKTVWQKTYIKEALNKMTNGKCCYCEVKLGEEGKNMHVEHFHSKSKYPDEVVEWNNLLPSCNRCNSNKGALDTYEEEIINPTVDDPKDYFYIKNYRYKVKNNSEKARRTIDVLYLNDSAGLVSVRFSFGENIQEKIEDLLEKTKQYISDDNKRIDKRNKIVFGIRDLLNLAQPSKEYSATIATLIIGDEDYKHLRELMIQNDLWNEDLSILEKSAKQICLLE